VHGVAAFVLLQSLDITFLHHTIATTLAQKGHSVQLLFAFEYIILASAAAATFLKYILSMLDAAMEGRWDGKGTYVFYLELLTDMLHLFVYCIFFVIVFTNYGLPLHLVRGARGREPHHGQQQVQHIAMGCEVYI
jgi:E3 ubiquitin-protein ligase synoviolin